VMRGISVKHILDGDNVKFHICLFLQR
jgi:hypothetical protein